MKKNLCACGIIALMSMSLFACSSNSDTNTSNKQATTKANESQTNESQTNESGDVIIDDFVVEGTDSYTISEYVGEATEITIPTELNGVPVSHIGFVPDAWGHGNETVETIRIEEGAELSIGAISGFKSAKELILPTDGNIVFEMGSGSNCTLESIVFTEAVTYINNSAFIGCRSITSVEFRCADNYYLGMNAFKDCQNLTSVTFTSGKPYELWLDAFEATAISELELPEMLEDDDSIIGSLEDMENITKITFKNGRLKYYGDFVQNCPNIETIDFGKIDFYNEYSVDGHTFFDTETAYGSVDISYYEHEYGEDVTELMNSVADSFSFANVKCKNKEIEPETDENETNENETNEDETPETAAPSGNTLNVNGTDYTFTIYEAENAIITDGATNNSDHVGWIGKGGYVSYDNITVDANGTYYLLLRYRTGEERNFQVSVNGADPIVVTCPSSGDFDYTSADIFVEVQLVAGTNTIKVYNDSAYAPNLDAIGIALITAE